MSVFDLPPALHTEHMEAGARATAFVTGAAGFVGTELIKVLVSRGHQVFGLAPSLEAAERVRRAGGKAVMGDFLTPGKWQDDAAADWVFHLPPHPLYSARPFPKGVPAIARERLRIDAHLLDAVAAGPTRRIVYFADASCYGATSERPITEDTPLEPSARGRYLAPALDRLDGYLVAGLPVVSAFPGWIYGNASWFRKRVIEPTMAGRRVLQIGAAGPWVSPIHVRDCARALAHLAEHGEVGGRYFLANSDAIQLNEFAGTFARLAHRRLRVWRLPSAAARLVAGPVAADYLRENAVLSNIRLRGIGFRFKYPTLEQGLQQILGALDE